ncbi:hypothetical protein THRCLA_02600 [Thraustotheca clavata]|uniref:RING-type domain-containing protein n=1 Tax=Thraustotheca clavata TaxID=74557 RepID=A0A1W0A4L2_9STRA|nr:hypothetical protein THRCLA_02600 [Thraustotheca clavata]
MASPAQVVSRSPTGLNVRVTVRYPAPLDATVRDVLGLFRSSAWVNFMVRYVVPYLKTSTPVNKEVLESLEQTTCMQGEEECVICMNGLHDAVKLPCGHLFHMECIDAWLRMRSTCPTCRYRFQNEFSGRYAFRGINTALIVEDVETHISPNELQNFDLSGKTVKAIVHVSLIPIAHVPTRQTFPCELNAIVVPQSTLSQHIEARKRKQVEETDCVSSSGCHFHLIMAAPKSLNVRMNLKYRVPSSSTMGDIMKMLHTPAWVQFITRYIVPYLKSSTPANKLVRDNLVKVVATAEDGDCAVCMQAFMNEDTVRVECGHLFHSNCIETWLKLRSTCPTCRFQFAKEVNGSFAIRGINTAVVLPQMLHTTTNNADLMEQDISGETLSTIVHVTLAQLCPTQANEKFPCELNAIVVRNTNTTAIDDNSVSTDSGTTMKRANPETTTDAPIGKRTRSH